MPFYFTSIIIFQHLLPIGLNHKKITFYVLSCRNITKAEINFEQLNSIPSSCVSHFFDLLHDIKKEDDPRKMLFSVRVNEHRSKSLLKTKFYEEGSINHNYITFYIEAIWDFLSLLLIGSSITMHC